MKQPLSRYAVALVVCLGVFGYSIYLGSIHRHTHEQQCQILRHTGAYQSDPSLQIIVNDDCKVR
jgi:hypothetical protein